MLKQWFILKNGVETGPFDKQGILLRVQKGILAPDDMIRKENTTQWHPLGKVKGLFPKITAYTAGKMSMILVWATPISHRRRK